MLNTKELDAYLTECKLLLGTEWMKQAETTVVGYDTVASIAKRWCIHCYLMYINEKDCTTRLLNQFPEVK